MRLSMDVQGTPFQLRVWGQLRAIRVGTTRSYGQIAARMGRPSAARAVGRAIGSNPVSILIPCHRAIGSDGSLTGYRWGLGVKEKLLALEHERVGSRKDAGEAPVATLSGRRRTRAPSIRGTKQ